MGQRPLNRPLSAWRRLSRTGQSLLLILALSTAPPAVAASLEELLEGPLSTLVGEEPLPAEKAFRVEAELDAADRIGLHFRIARGYYLYRRSLKALSGTDTVSIGELQLPPGEEKADPEFGPVEIYRGDLEVTVPILARPEGTTPFLLEVHYQGCAERGICYPPQVKRFRLSLPPAEGAALAEVGAETSPLAEEERIAASLARRNLLWTVPMFFGFGLLLAFTPCVFPTIPILAGILVGHGQRITPARGLALSLAYVLAHASVYALFGIVAALFGANLQAAMQHPAVIGSMALLFVLLALSMFGFYELQLPSRWQTALDRTAMGIGGGRLLNAALMGGLSALVIGPCVAAPLAGALLYIARSGDLLLGGLALFAMGFGMGAPLLVVGISAGKLLPKAGRWMHSVKAVFGVLFLGVAIWLLERILPPQLTIWLWAFWLIVPAIYLGATTPLPREAGHAERIAKALGLCMLTYGLLLIAGAAAGNYDLLQPLRFLAARSVETETPPPFRTVKTPNGLSRVVAEARLLRKPLLLDFYADWCVSCKELERWTFGDPEVRKRLADFLPVRIDVTENLPPQKRLLERFDLIGPPAILFLSPEGRECRQLRLIGYKPPEEFLRYLERASRAC